MDKVFQIGRFIFRVILPPEVMPPEHFMRFESKNTQAAYTYEFELCDAFPPPDGELVARRGDLLVVQRGELERRYFCVNGMREYYACLWEKDAHHAVIYLARAVAGMMHIDPLFLSLFAMERRIHACDSMVLHCAYMQLGDGAILFSAPSGTGKTTQAELWQQHRGTRVINGDRALLMKRDGIWTANGWPVCGSSGICYNEDMPIRAIVMLSQGKENTIARLTPMQAFFQIYGQVTVNGWNTAAQKHAMDLIERLITQVPVYHLSCTISPEAVYCLEKALVDDGVILPTGEIV